MATLESLHDGSLGGATSAARLSRELEAGFALDAKRKAEDAMKKRAIHTAASYDEFRNLVACASQTPLAPSDFAARAEVAANRMAGGGARGLAPPCDLGLAAPGGGGGGGGDGGGGADAGVAASAAAAMRALARGGGGGGGSGGSGAAAAAPAAPSSWGAAPASCLELDRAFRRHAGAARAAYVEWLGPARLAAAFRRDVDAPVLGALVAVLAAAARGGGEAAARALAAAAAVAAAAPPPALGRAMDMLDTAERADAAALAAAADGAPDADAAAAIRAAFGE